MSKTLEISVHDLHEILKKDKTENTILVDVRTKAEHKEVKIKGATNIPLNELESHKKELEQYDTVFVHCRSGGASHKRGGIPPNLKHPAIVNVKGGILEWEAEGFHVEKHKGFRLPLLRQVQIGAGSLVLIGVILSFTVNSQWALLSGFAGAGLLFAGITGWCGMAELLARMPWNK